MANFVLTGVDGALRFVDAGETGIIARGGVLTNHVMMVAQPGQQASLVVQGAIASSSMGVWLDGGNGTSNIMVSQGGIISGYLGIRNETNLNNMFISNAGMIEGYLSGAILSRLGAAATITNTGTIQTNATGTDAFDGFQHAAINVQGSMLKLNNTGTIAAPSYAIVTGSTTFALISNTGTISASVALRLGDGLDIVENAGLIRGQVFLSGGLDYFDGRLGRQQDGIYGGAGNDTLLGGASDAHLEGGTQNDRLLAAGGDDSVVGDDGNDTLRGGQGDDAIRGGAGADQITGGAGDDTLTGGTGADTFVFARGQGTDRVTDFVNNIDKLDLRAFDLVSVAAVVALASASSFGLRIDVPGEGVIFVQGLTLALLSAGDVLL
jgi:Ca2+-binding RTX toxin-like protein